MEKVQDNLSVNDKSQETTSIFDSNKFMKVFKWFIPTIVVTFILLLNYAIKGIAPFGNNYISYIDMEIGYVPVYYSLWDVVHSGGSLFYNFFLGAGSNVYGSLVSNALYSPLTWIVCIVPRASISAFLSWFLIIKLSLMATTMYLFIRKVFTKVPHHLQLLYAVMWAFSGYVFGYYTNIIWLDNMILFPILCLGIRRIMNQNKMDLYLTILTFCLLFSFYTSFMMLLMIIFCGSTAVYFSGKTKEEKRKIVTKLVIATLLALFISFISFLPAFWQSWTSHRIANAKKDILYENTWSKLIIIAMSYFAVFGFVKLCSAYKQDKRTVKMFIVMVALTTVTIFLERANMLWHTGSYQAFPYRFSFIPIFILICSGLCYFNNFYDYKYETGKKSDWTIHLLLIAIVGGAFAISVASQYPAFPIDFAQSLIYVFVAAVAVFYLFCLFKTKNKLWINIFVPIVCFIEAFSGSLGLIGQWAKNPVNKAADTYNAFYENLDMPDNDYRYATYFVKEENKYMAHYYNYPYIIRRQSMSTWLHIIGSDQVNSAFQLGYQGATTQITSGGSNYFANMTSGVRYVLTDTRLDARVYTLLDEYEDYYLYEYNFYLPYSGIYMKEDLISNIPTEHTDFAASNYLYNNVYNKAGNLFDTLTATKVEEDGKIKITVSAPNDALVYMHCAETEETLPSITVNEVKSYVSYGTFELGYSQGSTYEIVIDKEYSHFCDKFTFACVDVSKLEDLAQNNNIEGVELDLGNASIKKTVTASAGESLYIPYNYDSGWKAYVNGKEVKINKVMNTYMAIDLEEGENVVEMKYVPPMFNIGLIVSLVTLVLVLILWIVNKHTRFLEGKIFNSIFYYIGVGVFIIAGVVVYLRPLVQTIIYLG